MIGRLFRRTPDWQEEASAFVDGELPAVRRAVFLKRLRASPMRRAYVEELRQIKATLVALPQPAPSRRYTLTPLQAVRARHGPAALSGGAEGRGRWRGGYCRCALPLHSRPWPRRR